MARLARTYILLSASVLVGCQEPSPPHFGTLRYESENFEVWASESLSTCGGTYRYMEDWLETLRGELGGHAASRYHRFYWGDDEDFPGEYCRTTVGCATSLHARAYSTLLPLEHEVAHLEFGPRDPPGVFLEGAAEAFGTPSTRDVTIADIGPLFEIPAHERIDGLAYRSAGRFVSFLVETLGLDEFMELYAELDGAAGTQELQAIFSARGHDLDGLLESHRDVTPCTPDSWRSNHYACSAVPLTSWAGETWESEVDLSCGSDEAIGPRYDRLWTHRAFDLSEAGVYTFEVRSDDPTVEVDFLPCDYSCFDPVSIGITGATPEFWPRGTYPAGRYWMRISADADAQPSIAVRITR